jgi:hypothetical protein
MHNKKTVVIVAVMVVIVILIAFFAVERWSGSNVAHAPELSVAVNGGGTTGIATSSGASSSLSAVFAPTSSVKNPASASTKKTYAGSSFAFSYPASWSIFNVRPFSITNFNGQYVSEDVIPMGGAEIDVVTTTNFGDLKNIMATELMGAANLTTSTVAVSNVACSEANYGGSFSNGVPSKNIAVYCERGTELWKLYIAYRGDDPSGSTYRADFDGVLGSMKFLP